MERIQSKQFDNCSFQKLNRILFRLVPGRIKKGHKCVVAPFPQLYCFTKRDFFPCRAIRNVVRPLNTIALATQHHKSGQGTLVFRAQCHRDANHKNLLTKQQLNTSKKQYATNLLVILFLSRKKFNAKQIWCVAAL